MCPDIFYYTILFVTVLLQRTGWTWHVLEQCGFIIIFYMFRFVVDQATFQINKQPEFWIMALQKDCGCRLEYLDLWSVNMWVRLCWVFILTLQLCVHVGDCQQQQGVMGSLLIQIRQYDELLTPQTAEIQLSSYWSWYQQGIYTANVNSSFVVVFSLLSVH